MKNPLIILSLVTLPACGGDDFANSDHEPDMSLGGEPDHGVRPTGGSKPSGSGGAEIAATGGEEASGGTTSGSGGAASTGGEIGEGGAPGTGGAVGTGGDVSTGGSQSDEPPEVTYMIVHGYVQYGNFDCQYEGQYTVNCAHLVDEDPTIQWQISCNNHQPPKDALTCVRRANDDTINWCCSSVDDFHPVTGWPE